MARELVVDKLFDGDTEAYNPNVVKAVLLQTFHYSVPKHQDPDVAYLDRVSPNWRVSSSSRKSSSSSSSSSSARRVSYESTYPLLPRAETQVVETRVSKAQSSTEDDEVVVAPDLLLLKIFDKHIIPKARCTYTPALAARHGFWLAHHVEHQQHLALARVREELALERQKQLLEEQRRRALRQIE